MTEEQRQLAMDFQMTFDTPHGKRVLGAMKKWSGYEDRIIPVQGFPEFLPFELGKREFYLYIKDKMDADISEPEHQVEAVGEAAENKKGQRQETAIGE